LPITLPHGGMNVIQFQLATADGELTERNNSAVIQINGEGPFAITYLDPADDPRGQTN